MPRSLNADILSNRPHLQRRDVAVSPQDNIFKYARLIETEARKIVDDSDDDDLPAE